MSQLNRYRTRGYRVYSRGENLNAEQVNGILDLVHQTKMLKERSSNTLGGRMQLVEGALVPGGQVVVVKSYHRGGVLGSLLGAVHMRMFETRCRLESKVLEVARAAGANVPRCVAYVEEGEFLYRAWLVTEKISGSIPLIDYVRKFPEQAREKLEKLSAQVRLLIEAGIHHVDLHPGNAVVADDGSVWLVDFDKAYSFQGKKNRLRDLYLRRWRRAVIKHQLPEILSEVVSLALRENFEVAANG